MKTIICSLLTLPLLAFASPETTLDLAKFSALAKSQIEAAYGAGAIDMNSVQLVFVDGAGSADTERAFDLAHVNYVAQVKVDAPEKTQLVVYRLMLGGSRLDLRRANFVDGVFYYAVAGAGTVTVKEPTAEKMQILADGILNVAPDAKLNVLSGLGIILYECLPMNAVKAEKFLRAHPDVLAVEADGEHYMDAAFAPAQILNSKALKVDLDSLRTLTNELRRNGVALLPEASVPPELR